ncbi:diphthamide biosynthesis enzyme Dph2 [Metallosphaera tengchongensis]|uniref:2-(3-amino-3-carboxypropyl)histidine synthase n=1 Tax=Metallosphaera tengchongensis TaxID=1532350 RepID=A0A6N0NUP4_9CREN|nr:diphthamide biosynthesis enzyme Dph2 [Metallosphaera tengchongensis]QKQ99458.1 diphthamide biosynthesis enzyme Dph2 [Metallosphaera tengchongensis]
MSYFFDEEYLKSELIRRKVKRVLLQFPEGLRYFSTEIVERLRSVPDVEFIISGEPSWGACDIAEDEASLLKVDLIVHFGHSPYTWYYPKFPTLFVKAESKLELSQEVLERLAASLNDLKVKRVALTSTVQHGKLIPVIRDFLTGKGFEILVGKPSSPFMGDGQVLGCDYKSAMVDADVHVNVSGGVFHSLGLGLATGKPVIKVDPYTGSVEDISPQVFKVLKIRYSKIMEAMDSNTWVIIQGLKVGQNRPLMVKSLESRLRSLGKRTFVVTSKVLTKDSLRNLDRSYIDAFVVTSCPRLPTDDLYSYEKPVLTPGEAKMIITNKLEPYIFPW